MKKTILIKRGGVYSITLLALLFFLIFLMKSFVYNSTASLPIGLYEIIDKKIERNDIVVFCPKYSIFIQYAIDNGFWKGLHNKCGITPNLMKKAVGVPNDKVSVKYTGVYVNSVKIKNSEPFEKILADKLFQNYEKKYLLGDDEYFMMSDYHSRSYDSRYLGIVKKDEIKAVVIPFLTKEPQDF